MVVVWDHATGSLYISCLLFSQLCNVVILAFHWSFWNAYGKNKYIWSRLKVGGLSLSCSVHQSHCVYTLQEISAQMACLYSWLCVLKWDWRKYFNLTHFIFKHHSRVFSWVCECLYTCIHIQALRRLETLCPGKRSESVKRNHGALH